MTQSISFSHEQHYLQVVNKPVADPSNSFAVKTGNAPLIENILFSKVSPLFYKTRVRISLALSDQFKENFGLIKGLIEFHRLQRFFFEYNFDQRTIEADIETGQLYELQSFLDDVCLWLKREIHFRNSLKLILEFENRYKLAKAEVYASIQTVPN